MASPILNEIASGEWTARPIEAGDNAFASGSIISGSIADGTIFSGQIASGQIGGPHLASGAVQSGHIGNAAVVSGSIASGQVGSTHLASGLIAPAAEYLVDDTFQTAEPISGVRAAGFTPSGYLQIAMASVSGRMPAAGVVVDNYASGVLAKLYHRGRLFSTGLNFSGFVDKPIFVGQSGILATAAPTVSGSQTQRIGFAAAASGLFVGMDEPKGPRAASLVVDPNGNGDFRDLKSAVDALGPQGGRIFLREGVIPVSVTITLPDAPVEFVGAGRNATTIALGGNAISLFSISATNNTFYAFSDFNVTSNGVTGQKFLDVLGTSVADILIKCSYLHTNVEVTFNNDGGANFVIHADHCDWDLPDLSTSLLFSTSIAAELRAYDCTSKIITGGSQGGGFSSPSGASTLMLYNGEYDFNGTLPNAGYDLINTNLKGVTNTAILHGSGFASSCNISCTILSSSMQLDNCAFNAAPLSGANLARAVDVTGSNKVYMSNCSISGPFTGAGNVRIATNGNIIVGCVGVVVEETLTTLTDNRYSVIQSGLSMTTAFASLIDGATNSFIDALITAEPVSGARFVAINTSGAVVQAGAARSGRMPAIGLVTKAWASGTFPVIFTRGRRAAGFLNTPTPGGTIWVGLSGEPVNTVPTASGAILQHVGIGLSSGLYLETLPASGSVDYTQLSSGVIRSGTLGDNAVVSGSIASGQVFTLHIASGGLLSGAIGSGQIGQFHLASGSVTSGAIASGQIHQFALSSGAVSSGQTASGLVVTFARNIFVDSRPTAELISGVKAIAYASGATAIVRAERNSGLRLPAIGVTYSGAVSGTIAVFVRYGVVPAGVSGMIASGFHSRLLYVGSGGLIVNQSGFMDGASSGAGPTQATTSGSAVQSLGIAVSGGIFVDIDPFVRSGVAAADAMSVF